MMSNITRNIGRAGDRKIPVSKQKAPPPEVDHRLTAPAVSVRSCSETIARAQALKIAVAVDCRHHRQRALQPPNHFTLRRATPSPYPSHLAAAKTASRPGRLNSISPAG